MSFGRPTLATAPITVYGYSDDSTQPSSSSSYQRFADAVHARPFFGRLSYVSRDNYRVQPLTNVYQPVDEAGIFKEFRGGGSSMSQSSQPSSDNGGLFNDFVEAPPPSTERFENNNRRHWNEPSDYRDIYEAHLEQPNRTEDLSINNDSYNRNYHRFRGDDVNSYEDFDEDNPYLTPSSFFDDYNNPVVRRARFEHAGLKRPPPRGAATNRNSARTSNKKFSKPAAVAPAVACNPTNAPELDNKFRQCFFYKPFERTNFRANRPLLAGFPRMHVHYCMYFENLLDPPDDGTTSRAEWERLKKTTNMHACCESHKKLFSHVTSLRLFDYCYETSLWDYHPKFVADYLPNTKRGVADPFGFVYNVDYVGEENKWRQYEHVLQQKNVEKIGENILRMASKGDAECQKMADQMPKKTFKVSVDKRIDRLMKTIEDEVKFPESGITDDCCIICGDAFTSVLASMGHYESDKHINMVNAHFVEGLVSKKAIKNGEQNETLVINLIKHFSKKFKTKPASWQCELCSVTLTSTDQAEFHFSGASHKRNASMCLSGPMLYKAAGVDPPNYDEEIDEEIERPPPNKKLRIAPPSQKFGSHTYVGRFGR